VSSMQNDIFYDVTGFLAIASAHQLAALHSPLDEAINHSLNGKKGEFATLLSHYTEKGVSAREITFGVAQACVEMCVIGSDIGFGALCFVAGTLDKNPELAEVFKSDAIRMPLVTFQDQYLRRQAFNGIKESNPGAFQRLPGYAKDFAAPGM